MDSRKKAVLLIGSLVSVILIIVACATQPIAPVEAEPVVTAKPETVPPEKKEPVSPYDVDIKPLTTAECGPCHFSIFNQIRHEGGRHRIDCVQCHEKFHAYNPIRQNWKEIMPRCETCHGIFHGDKFAACAQCHSNPHAPKTQMAMTPEFAKMCGDCHAKVGQELKQNPSKHTKVACSMCHHDRHGYIPSCMECHRPHVEKQTDPECLSCHPVHSPININYAHTVPNAVCGSCHGAVFNKLEASASRHRLVTCAQCHSKHKYIPTCEECHGKPHGEGLLKKFPNCLQCHIDVHDLPTKSASR
ncbi:MAG: cytochrome C [Nitrospirae bacterium]|nr:cytochrome C [Nitrospirota bacterium]MBE0428035.1 cytochrome C [Nitrospirota bacterium]